MPVELPSFTERGPSYSFDPPTAQRGYFPQVHEKLGQWFTWEVINVGGQAHTPTFRCTPVWCGTDRLEQFAAEGPSKKAAREKAAEAIALSGHC